MAQETSRESVKVFIIFYFHIKGFNKTLPIKYNYNNILTIGITTKKLKTFSSAST